MSIASRVLSQPCPRPARVEALERRALFALAVQIDYTFDVSQFFDTQEERDVMQAAADAAVAPFRDRLEAINPTSGNTWKAIIDDPFNGGVQEVDNLSIPENTLLVYVGARDMVSLGMGGPGGFSSTGSPAWNDRVASRGQSNARGSNARDFGPWGGSISFDASPAGGWYFGADPAAIAGRTDFYSVALHEMTHLLGFGTSDSWLSRVRDSSFTGPAAVTEYATGGDSVPLSSDRAHWASGTISAGREAAMDPDLSTGSRKEMTPLDLAAMDDLGWDVSRFAAGNDATFTDASGDVVNVSLQGPGSGELVFENLGDANPREIRLSGTTAASTLTITAAGAGTTLGGLTVDGSLKSLTAKTVDLAGAMSVSGGVSKLLLRNASGSIALGGAGGSMTVTLAAARDLSVTSAASIKSMKVTEWLDTDATPDVITAPVLSTLSVKGALEADVNAGTIGKISAGGALRGADIRAANSIGTVTVASASDSFVYAGVRSDLSTLPDALDDFANPAAWIKGVTLKSRLGTFSNTRIAAPMIGKTNLGSATIGTSAGNPFGVAADRITSAAGATSIRGPYKITKRDDPGSGFGLIDFAIVVL